MTGIHRLVAVSTFLGLAAVFTSTDVWGEPSKKARERPMISGSQTTPDHEAKSLADDLAGSKFSASGVVTYRTRQGDLLFALQVKPKLEAVATRPCDYLIMVDTSASQVGSPLATAQKIALEITKNGREDDRFSIWTVNIPAATSDLTRGFQEAKSSRVREALEALKWEVPYGDTDLNKGLEKAIGTFELDRSRQHLIVFLGDGMSIHNPITPSDRARLCESMVKSEVAFFSVPLGPRLDPQNLHGLATGTGGRVVRMQPADKAGDFVKRLSTLVSAPILYPTNFQLPAAQVAEFFPTRLPPLRGDVATLVVGRLNDANALPYTVEGTVAGRETRVEMSEAVAPSELDNFFLVGMVEQWKNAKDQPALMQADRALAFSQEMNQVARAELLAKAQLALAKDKFEAAKTLYEQARDLDPSDPEAQGGLMVVEKLRDGKLTKDQLQKEFNRRDRVGLIIEKDPAGKNGLKVRRERLDHLLAQAEKPRMPAPAGANLAPAVDPNDLLQQNRLRQDVEEQRLTQSVDESLREARRILPTDPDSAKDLVKRTLAAINDNPDIRENVRLGLVNRLDNMLQRVETEGKRIKQDQAERQRVSAIAADRMQLLQQKTASEERIQARMRVFHNLMNQARFEDAYNQALDITRDQISVGAPVPVAVTAAYNMGLAAKNLSEMQELKRLREERFLATMMQVEKSHVPFPDEPPIVFPPAASWRELSNFRKERYENSGLTEEDPVTMKKIRDLKEKLTMPVTVDFESGPLKDALGFLSERYSIPIIVDTEAFKTDVNIPDIDNSPVKLSKLSGISLGTVLRLLLAQVQGTFIIRREFIEVTTAQRQAAEKAIRVYPVADLVIPIPNGVNQNAVNQGIQNSILGFQVDLARASFGGALGGLGLNGGVGGIGGLGGGLGGLGGGLGGLGGGLGGLGLGGGQLMGAAGVGGGGPQNLGAGGGQSGFAGFGGQLGQFGNLGGQFGLQGGDQSAILIRLIRQVVGEPRDWGALDVYQRGQGVGVPNAGRDADDENAGDPNQAGALGYYPPARALIVKGTSRIHTRLGGGLLGPRAAGPAPDKMGALDKIKKDFVAKGGNGNNPLIKLQQVADATKRKKKPEAVLSDLDARKIWQEALAKGVSDPGLIIAVADYLFEHKKFEHAAEFLKADLRQGIVTRPWVYESLAIALKEAKGSITEIERAELSALDLEPQDANSYLRASHAMADNKRWDRALAFCRQASVLEPNAPMPYSEALLYAELNKDTEAMEWAAGNLLSRDWTADNAALHDKAFDKLKSLVQVLQAENRQTDAEKLTQALNHHRQRDLVVRLTWQGSADLDLKIREPIGTVCSFMQHQTPGGGILLGDNLSEANSETYAAAQAFSGEYQITVQRVWGKPLGSKATLEIIEHQGTPEETRRRETIVFDKTHTLKLVLSQGRRKSIAQVPPPSKLERPKSDTGTPAGGSSILTKLRSLADPDLITSDTGMQGGMASAGRINDFGMAKAPPPASSEQLTYQAKVSSLVSNSMDMTAQASVSADRRYVRLSLSPVFETAGGSGGAAIMSNPLIPGANP